MTSLNSCKVVVLPMLAYCLDVSAQPEDRVQSQRLSFVLAPYVIHYRPQPEHNDYPWLLGLEWEREDAWLVGITRFRNSFDQRSHYLYFGRRLSPGFMPPNTYLKWTVGLLEGYKEPYHGKIPLNHRDGLALGALPAVGYQADRWSLQLVPLGSAGLMLTLGIDLLSGF